MIRFTEAYGSPLGLTPNTAPMAAVSAPTTPTRMGVLSCGRVPGFTPPVVEEGMEPPPGAGDGPCAPGVPIEVEPVVAADPPPGAPPTAPGPGNDGSTPEPAG